MFLILNIYIFFYRYSNVFVVKHCMTELRRQCLCCLLVNANPINSCIWCVHSLGAVLLRTSQLAA